MVSLETFLSLTFWYQCSKNQIWKNQDGQLMNFHWHDLNSCLNIMDITLILSTSYVDGKEYTNYCTIFNSVVIRHDSYGQSRSEEGTTSQEWFTSVHNSSLSYSNQSLPNHASIWLIFSSSIHYTINWELPSEQELVCLQWKWRTGLNQALSVRIWLLCDSQLATV